MKTFVLADDAQRQRFKLWLDRQPLPLQVEAGEPREQRTSDQNRRLWKLHQLAAKATGYSPDELHELMLCKHFGVREMKVGALSRPIPLKRSSARDKREFSEFMEFVESFYAAELGVWLGQEAA